MFDNKELIRFLEEQGDSVIAGSDKTHWEALAQTIWKKALGYEIKDQDGKFVEYVSGDKASIDKLFDHIVGKPKAAPLPKKNEKKADKVPLAARVGNQLASHVNQQGDKDADTGGQDKTRTKGSLSQRVRDMAMRRNRDRSSKRPDKESAVEAEVTG